jgi:tetratricopeptide (TPR) repeat protein
MVSRITPRFAALAGCLLGLLPGMHLHASCIPLPDPALRSLDDLIIVNPVSVIQTAQDQLARTDPNDAQRLASLHAILSESYYQVERDAEAQKAAADGLAYLARRPDSDLLKLRLILSRVVPNDSAAEVEEGLRESNKILATLPSATLPYACALLVRARLYQAENRLDLAVADALTMYRITGANHWEEAHALAAEAFGSFYADTGDLDEARRFLHEAIAYAEGLHATNWLSVTHYFLGRLNLRATAPPWAISAAWP